MRAFPYAAVLRILVPVAAALAASLALVAGLSDANFGTAMRALWEGSLGTSYSLWSATLVRAVPLLLTGAAVALAFRSGALNIGAEGQLLAGAAASTAVAMLLAGLPGAWLLCLIAGCVGGFVWAAVAAVLRIRFGVLEVISTILLNFLGLHLVGLLVRGPVQEPSRIYPQSAPLPDAARLGTLVENSRLHWGFPLALLLIGLLWFLLARTELGFRLRVTGASATVAASAGGIRTERVIGGALCASGVLAGLAGAVEVQGVTFALYENLSPGYGYTAIAVALLARLEMGLLLPSAIFFAALQAGAAGMQRDANVPAAVATVIEAIAILACLWLASTRRRTHQVAGA